MTHIFSTKINLINEEKSLVVLCFKIAIDSLNEIVKK